MRALSPSAPPQAVRRTGMPAMPRALPPVAPMKARQVRAAMPIAGYLRDPAGNKV